MSRRASVKDKLSDIFMNCRDIFDTPCVLIGVIIIINVIGVVLNWNGWCTYFTFDFLTSTGRDIIDWYFDMMVLLFPQVFLSVLWFWIWSILTGHFWEM